MNLTRSDITRLGRQRLQPVKAEGELLAVFVAGELVNPLNASAWRWQKRSRLAKQSRRCGYCHAWLLSTDTGVVPMGRAFAHRSCRVAYSKRTYDPVRRRAAYEATGR